MTWEGFVRGGVWSVTVSSTDLAEIEQAVTYEVVLEVSVHVVNSVVHDTCRNASASEAQRPCWFHVQIKLRYPTRLAGVVLHIQYKKLRLRRAAARCFVSLNILLSNSMLHMHKIIGNSNIR